MANLSFLAKMSAFSPSFSSERQDSEDRHSHLIEAIKKEGYSFIIVANGQKIERAWLEGAIGSVRSDHKPSKSWPRLCRLSARDEPALGIKGIRFRRLLYCNDSVFYLDRNDPRKFSQHLITSDDPLDRHDGNYYKTYHVSSWCFQMTHTVLNAQAFVKFWKIYRPVNSRRHAINRGELGSEQSIVASWIYSEGYLQCKFSVKNILDKQDVTECKVAIAAITHNLSPAEIPRTSN